MAKLKKTHEAELVSNEEAHNRKITEYRDKLMSAQEEAESLRRSSSVASDLACQEAKRIQAELELILQQRVETIQTMKAEVIIARLVA